MPHFATVYRRRVVRASIHGGPPLDSRGVAQRPTRSWVVPALFVIAGTIALVAVDVPLARADLKNTLPKSIVQLLNHGETFGNGFGVAFILATVGTLDPRRRALVRLACASWGAGLVANLVKLTVTRSRPFFWLEDAGGGLADQFGAWFPLGTNGGHLQSFPSAHTATAVGLAIGLTALYPRGAKLFAGFAALVACQRVTSDMHYTSDTLFAAAIASAWCLALYGRGRIAAMFDAWERRDDAPGERHRAPCMAA